MAESAAAVATVAIGADIIAVAPAAVADTDGIVIIRAVAIPAVIADAAGHHAAGCGDHEQAGNSGNR
jgi:hypothetical protein